jgi:hypothetical protein
MPHGRSATGASDDRVIGTTEPKALPNGRREQ